VRLFGRLFKQWSLQLLFSAGVHRSASELNLLAVIHVKAQIKSIITTCHPQVPSSARATGHGAAARLQAAACFAAMLAPALLWPACKSD
jgi:hypothetical protein